MSINGHLDKNSLINSIRLQINHPSGKDKVWIIVEGITDQLLFSKLFHRRNVEIEISYGGLNSLLKAVSELLEETDRVIGIRDADFLHLEKIKEPPENIFLTDYHDVEMMLIACDKAYSQVAAEYLKQEILRDKILQSIAFIAGIRWINDSCDLELNFKGLGFGNFYDGNTAELDEEKCLNEIIKRSPNKKEELSKEDVEFKIENVSDYFNLCNGHDFHKALALIVSSNSKKGINDAEIGKEFRIAYRFEDFQQSDLYKRLIKWSDSKEKSIFYNRKK